MGATMYTVLIARNSTRGQPLDILVGIGIQILFVWLHGVSSTFDALLLNLWVSAGFLFLQLFLIGWLIYVWPREKNTYMVDNLEPS